MASNPVLKYQNKETVMIPFMTFWHDGIKYISSDWDTNKQGEEVFLAYRIDGNKVFLDSEIEISEGEIINCDSLPELEDQEWEYIQDDEISVGSDSLDSKDLKVEFEEKLAEIREKVKKESAEIAASKVNMDDVVTKSDNSVQYIKDVDDREDEEVDEEPSDEELADELIVKNDKIQKIAPEKKEALDTMLKSIEKSKSTKVEPTDTFFKDMLSNLDKKMEKAVNIPDSKKSGAITGLTKEERILQKEAVKKEKETTKKEQEIEEKGFSMEDTDSSKSNFEEHSKDEYLKTLFAEEDLVNQRILKKRKELAELEVLHKSPFYLNQQQSILKGMEYANPLGQNNNSPQSAVPMAGGFNRLVAIQSITQDMIIENAEAILALSKITPEQKAAIKSVAETILGIIGK